MIVTRLTVEGLRCFVEPTTIDLATDTLNLVIAPNGSGKSTLVKALQLAFLTSHKSAGEEVRSVVPWGRALAPRVTVEFEAAGTRWRVAKRWLQQSSATLEQWQSAAWSKVAEGPAAEERLRQFAGMKPGFDKGASSRDLFWTSVLWSDQGGLALKNIDASVVDQVRASLNQQLESGAAEGIAASAAQAFREFWTPTGREAKHAPTASLRHSLDDARARLASAQTRLDALEQARRDLDQLEERQGPLASRISGLEQEQQTASQRLQASAALRAQHEREAAALQLVQTEARQLQETIQRWTEAEERCRRQQARELELLREAGETPLEELAAAQAALESAEAAARDARAYAAARRERDTQLELCRRVDRLADERLRASAALGELNVPAPAVWNTLAKLWTSIAATRERLESALVHLEVLAERPLDLRVIEGEPEGAHALEAGAALRVSGSPKVEVEVPGVGRWLATGPASSAAELRAKLAKLESEWTASTAAYACSDYVELQQRRTQAEAHEKTGQTAATQLEALLAGRSLESLRLALQQSEAACAAHETRHPDWAGAPPDPDHCERLSQESRNVLEFAQRRVAAFREAASLRERIQEDEAELARWCSLHGSLDQLRDAWDALALRLRGHQLQLAELDKSLAGFSPDLDASVRSLAAQLQQAREQLDATRIAAGELRGRIEEQAAQAPYRSLAEAEEEVEELSRQLAQTQLRADALRCLKETLDECRQQISSGLVDSVAREASALLDQITGAPLGQLRLDDQLAPSAFAPAAAPAEVALSQLSGGENEQVHFATRLALADALSAAEPQLAVFDDVLMATDPARFQRILDMLESRLPRLQVLILTCHPERFAALAAARRVPLSRASL